VNAAPRAPMSLSPASFRRLASFVHAEIGIHLRADKLVMLQSRLQRRAAALGLDSLDDYCSTLLDSPAGIAERTPFFDAVTTNKTEFFRERAHLDLFARDVAAARRSVRVWCAGCATGEEPYSLAMLLGERAARDRSFDFAILATDISARVLETARLGVYPEAAADPIPPHLRAAFLRRGSGRQAGRVRVAPELRAKVAFASLNFMSPAYGIAEAFDAIFFRNVLIYFDPDTQRAVTAKIAAHLAGDGYFFIGHSETIAARELGLSCLAPSVYARSAP
jgi:chemotaxis protein methyltransferase CheR